MVQQVGSRRKGEETLLTVLIFPSCFFFGLSLAPPSLGKEPELAFLLPTSR